ncbi:hypothetical protein B0H19DRAFT_1063260 [Mycena capillaripes]|nr:hypothetical protein B0H19DRAFT_1063260 [Mycena capillaripes]
MTGRFSVAPILQLSFATADILFGRTAPVCSRMLGIFLGVKLAPAFLDICCLAWSGEPGQANLSSKLCGATAADILESLSRCGALWSTFAVQPGQANLSIPDTVWSAMLGKFLSVRLAVTFLDIWWCQSFRLKMAPFDLMPRMSVSVDASCNGSVARVKMKAFTTFDVRRTAAQEKWLGFHWMTISKKTSGIVILLLAEAPEGI